MYHFENYFKAAHKNKFKYMYIKFMSIVQNEYRNNPKCQENQQVGHDFACLTVCTLKTAENLMDFYTARTRDSILGTFKWLLSPNQVKFL